MKTIRRGVFETNSSSTHSITIGPISNVIDPKIQPLVEDNVLYPNRLSERTISTDLGYDTMSILTCSTKDEKAAIIANWLYCLYSELEEISYKEYIEKITLLRNFCGYEYINSDLDSDYYPENDDQSIFEAYPFEQLLNFIIDDEVKITDSHIPY